MLRQTTTENGTVRGLPGSDPRITAYKGIPFAAPPIGRNRWRAPQPCENWEGVRDAYAFAPISVQDTPGLGTDIYCREWHVDPEIAISEDCLYLNIWTPAKKTDEKLPVLVWFFGGAFNWGYTAEMEFDGEHLASRGIIVVSVNYRLGLFGFLSHPEITAEAPDAPGNFGLLDQQAGLRWVHRNIAAFGGDPERITIAGQSAGGASVMHQYTCDANRDLIKGAVVFSGMIRHTEAAFDIFKPLTLEAAEKRGVDFFKYLGIDSLEEARGIDAFELLARYNEYARNHPRMYTIVDGSFCAGDPIERFMEGKCADAPILSGNTSDEFIQGEKNLVELTVKKAFDAACAVRPTQKCYYYCFNPDIPGKDNPGVFHSVDLWFWFETIGKCRRPYVGRHFDLARQMCDMFACFVKNGDPNGIGRDELPLPVWKPYTAAEHAGMLFTGNGARPLTSEATSSIAFPVFFIDKYN